MTDYLGQDHRELVAADRAREVGGAHDVGVDSLSRLGEQITASTARCPIRSLIALKSSRSKTTSARLRLYRWARWRDLPLQRLVEVAPVVQSCQRIEIGELPRFAKPRRVSSIAGPARSARSSSSAALDSPNAARPPREPRCTAQLPAVGEQRHGESGANRVALDSLLGAAVAVFDHDDARRAAVRLQLEDRRRRHRLTKTRSGNEWLTALDGDRDHRALDTLERAGSSEGSREHLVEVDRAAGSPLAAGGCAGWQACARSSAAERSRTIDARRSSSSEATSKSLPSVLRRDLRASTKTTTARAVATSAAAQAMTIVVMTVRCCGRASLPRANCKRPRRT